MSLRFFPYYLLLFIAVAFASCNQSSNIVDSVSKLEQLVGNAQPGDTIVLKNGTWPNVQLEIKNSGLKGSPIVLIAETAGEVRFTENSYLSIAGDYIEIYGLLFTDGNSDKRPVITFKSGDHVASNCRVSNCAISYYNPSDRFLKANWLELYGKNNRVDHCSFVGKLNAGVTLCVRLNGEESQENNHLIDHNYFGERPRLGSNGGETMRVGTSTFSLTESNTQICDNYFEHCNGEVEILSLKSCNNTISRNTFYECEGVLTLRHGNNNVVTDNVFVGNNVPNTGGVRVINAGHTINNNHFQELAGHRFRAAFGVMNGVPNSAINRYHQVKNASFDNNMFINCENIAFGVGSDNERTACPQNSTFRNNTIYNKSVNTIITELDDMSGILYESNVFCIKDNRLSKRGFKYQAMSFQKNEDGLYANADYQPVMHATKENTGAEWYMKKVTSHVAPVEHIVSEVNNIQEIIKNAAPNDIVLINDDVVLDEPLLISIPLTFIGQPTDNKNPVLKYESNRDKQALVIIANGGELRLQNLDLNGASKNGIANVGIGTQSEPAIEHYKLFADNCSFYNFAEGKATIFKVAKSTFADSIVFTSCIFHTTSGMAINLKAEKEDLGKYNAEYVILKNCLFYNIMGSAIDLYRGGNDESTTGPSLQIDHCTFHNIENKELGSTVNLTGVQDIHITNCIFSYSGRSGRVIKLEDQGWIVCEIEDNIFYQCGRFESYYDKRLGKTNRYNDPGFKDVETNNYSLLGKSTKGYQYNN